MPTNKDDCFHPEGACKHCRVKDMCPFPHCRNNGKFEYIPGRGDKNDPFPEDDPEDDVFEIN